MTTATDLRSTTRRAAGRALPPGTRIRDYEVRSLLSDGWSGPVHLAFDHALQRLVALEHWEPEELSVRDEASLDVRAEAGTEAAYAAGLAAFAAESRVLARFDHVGLVRVWRFWDAHGTAWRTSPVLDGPTLGAALAAHGQPSTEAEARTWLAPLLDTLAVLHAADTVHGAITPERVVLQPTGPVLLGLDAARRAALAALGTPDRALAPGYAAIEQHAAGADGSAVGPWTDLYAVGALLGLAFTGRPPPPAPERLSGDPYEPLSAQPLAAIRETMLAAVDAALAPRPEQRPRHHAELRGLIGDMEAPRPLPALVPRADPMEEPFLGARLRPEEITIPDVPLVERSAEIAEAVSAVSRPSPLDGAGARRGTLPPLARAPRDAVDTSTLDAGRTTGPASGRWAALTDLPDPQVRAAATGSGRRVALLAGAFTVVAAAIGLFAVPHLRDPDAAASRAAVAPLAPGVSGAATATTTAPIAVDARTAVTGSDATPAAASAPRAVAADVPVPAAGTTPVAVAAPPASGPLTSPERSARCTEILQKASLEGIGVADSEFYKKECR